MTHPNSRYLWGPPSLVWMTSLPRSAAAPGYDVTLGRREVHMWVGRVHVGRMTVIAG